MATTTNTISWESIFRVVVTGLIILAVWKAISVLVMILVAIMLATALNPMVKLLDRRLPHFLSCLLVTLILLIPFVAIGASVIPAFVGEFPGLLTTINTIVETSPILPDSIKTIDFTQYSQNIGTYLVQSTSVVTNVATKIITMFFLTFYLMFDSERLINLALSIFSKYHQKKIRNLLVQLALVNGQYIRGNLFISLICGSTLFIGLTILGIPFAAPLAIFSAIMDLLPLVGSTIGMIPAVIIGFAISPVTALLVLILYLVYQQIENAFLIPTIYNKALSLSPALGFLAVIIGSSLFGIIGAFLALPMAASLPSIIKFVREDLEDKTIV